MMFVAFENRHNYLSNEYSWVSIAIGKQQLWLVLHGSPNSQK
jgi:hypothetical protein